MEATVRSSRIPTRLSTPRAAAIVGSIACLATLLLAAAPAQAFRLPTDPIAFAPTPPALSRLVVAAHAANVRVALEDLRVDRDSHR